MQALRPIVVFVVSAFLRVLSYVVGITILSTLTVLYVKYKENRPPKPGTVLVIDLACAYEDAPVESGNQWLSHFFNSGIETVPLHAFTEALERAAKDKNIAAVFLHGEFDDSPGWANLREMRAALDAFEGSGKPVYAYGVDMEKEEYYLLCAANTLMMQPSGWLFFNGLGRFFPFFGEAADTYGVEFQQIHAGAYKSFIEMFTRTGMTKEAREDREELLRSLWGTICSDVAMECNLTPESVADLASKHLLFTAQQAQEAQLIDSVGHYDEMLTLLEGIAAHDKDNNTFEQIELTRYIRLAPDLSGKSKKRIAVVYAQGDIILDGEDTPSRDVIDGQILAHELRELRKNKEIAAVVLRVNSPGGSGTASEIIAREVDLMAKERPMVVSMGNVAASGGYWMSAPATKIFAEPTTITGSIGVFMLRPNIKKLGNSYHVYWDGAKTSPYADCMELSRAFTPAEMEIFDGLIKDEYQKFVMHVATCRKLEVSAVEAIAQGHVWSGTDALARGLVDQIGGLDDAVAEAAHLASLAKDQYYITYEAKEESFINGIKRNLQAAILTCIPVEARQWLKSFARAQAACASAQALMQD